MQPPRLLLKLSVPRCWWLIALPAAILAVGAYQNRWITDDGFINLRIVRQIEAGRGPVFNPGERVEAGTSILWLLVLTVLDVITPVQLEYIAAYSGIVFTLAGMTALVAGATRITRTAYPSATLVPFGAIAVAVLAAMWHYASSGLETGLQFGWLGASVLALTAAPAHRSSRRLATSALVGLGPLVRPDLTLFTIALLTAHLKGVPRRRQLVDIGAAVAAPVSYQLFRMGFFATLVPNTALAKNAGTFRPRQGLRYLCETLGAYHLGPILLVAVAAYAWLVLNRMGRRGRAADGSPNVNEERQRLVRVGRAAAAGAGTHLTYVVLVGGDYMHARLLLPSLFVLLGLVVLPLPTVRRDPLATCAMALAFGMWAVWCAVGLRSSAADIDGIIDEHAFYAAQVPGGHPITLDDYRAADEKLVSYVIAAGEAARAERDAGRTGLFMFNGSRASGVPVEPYPATVYLVWPVVGMAGYAAGTDVFVVDQLGLGDPIVSRLDVPFRSRPGHEKDAPGWAILRLFPEAATFDAASGLVVKNADGDWVPLDGTAAVRLLDCVAVRRLVRDISAPLTLDRFFANIAHSPANTTLRVEYTPGGDSTC